MKFSILIANYNNGIYFNDCYNSILAQTYADWEAIIVDDGSTDDSAELIKNIIKDDNRFHFYLNDANKGCGYTKRKCVELSSGEWCGFLDPDDALLPVALEQIVAKILMHEDAVLVNSSLFHCNESLEIVQAYAQGLAVNNQAVDFFNLNNEVTAFTAFKRAAYNLTEGIDPIMKRAVDQDLYLKLAETGKFYFLQEPLYLYRKHKNGIASFENARKAQFWHLFAAMQAARRRNLDLEKYFLDAFITNKQSNKLNKILEGKADGSLYVKMLWKKIKRKLTRSKI
jgi:glycosyltransferase involved in cell wall biosynthesis